MQNSSDYRTYVLTPRRLLPALALLALYTHTLCWLVRTWAQEIGILYALERVKLPKQVRY